MSGAALSVDGVVSTRKGNAASWTAMLGRSPSGEWELSLPDNGHIRELFAREHLEDILFVITFSGRTPDWPV